MVSNGNKMNFTDLVCFREKHNAVPESGTEVTAVGENHQRSSITLSFVKSEVCWSCVLLWVCLCTVVPLYCPAVIQLCKPEVWRLLQTKRKINGGQLLFLYRFGLNKEPSPKFPADVTAWLVTTFIKRDWGTQRAPGRQRDQACMGIRRNRTGSYLKRQNPESCRNVVPWPEHRLVSITV